LLFNDYLVVLSTTVGRPEHPGRVRAAGAGVGLHTTLGLPLHMFTLLHH